MTGEVEGAEQPVIAQPIRADHRREPSLAHPAGDVHLKQPVLRMRIAEQAHGVIHVRGKDMRHTIAIADQPRLTAEASELNAAAGLWQASRPPDIPAGNRQQRQPNQYDCQPRESASDQPHTHRLPPQVLVDGT